MTYGKTDVVIEGLYSFVLHTSVEHLGNHWSDSDIWYLCWYFFQRCGGWFLNIFDLTPLQEWLELSK